MFDETYIPEIESGKRLRPGVDLLLTTQVAKEEHVDLRTVERWIADKGLPAQKASLEEIAELIQHGHISRIPPHGVILLVKKTDLVLIPKIRAYPRGTKRPRRGKKTGAGASERQ